MGIEKVIPLNTLSLYKIVIRKDEDNKVYS